MPKSNFISQTLAIFKKDIQLELKTKEIISSMLLFSMLVVVVFSFLFEPGNIEQAGIAGGVYWMALIFAGLLGLGKSMQAEINGGNLEALLLSPISRNAIFYGKLLSNIAFLLCIQLIMLPLFVVLYDTNLVSHISMLAVILGTTYAFSLLGTLFSLMAARSSTREILLPILLLPMLVPVILGAIQATNGALFQDAVSTYAVWIRLIVVYDVVFTAIASLLFEVVVEE
ncbi:MAG: heme exporter protein CcmB [Deferribacteraceae bacterium]|nr:heme exporter protein CcmB [Deferribacteraceae bacterium]